MYKNRNHKRLLDVSQIEAITTQLTLEFKESPEESAKYLMDFYLSNDIDGMFELISDWVEYAEDKVRRQLNTDLIEDSFNDEHLPHYDF